jgi:probable HAF family extracellular repeat protein
MPMNPRIKTAIISSALAFVLNASVLSAQVFSVTDLGTLPGNCCSAANAINFWGRVTGQTTDAFLWSPQSGMRDLGTLPNGGYSAGTAVNFFGQVAGYSGTPNFTEHAILWTAGQGMQDLGVLHKADSSDAYGLNDFDVVVGDSSSETGFDHAFIWKRTGGMRDLGTLPGGSISRATAINDFDTVVGYSTINGNTQYHTFHAFWLRPNAGPRDLGTLPGDDNSFAYAINLFGHVAGESVLSTAANDHAVLWRGLTSGNRTISDLGLLPGGSYSVASALSDSDVVVGFGDFENSGGSIHAFRWSADDGMEDLNDLIGSNSGWILLEATGINFRGQIVGTGMIDGEEHAFLLTPDFQGGECHADAPKNDLTLPAGLYAPSCETKRIGAQPGSIRLGCKRDER